LYEYRKIRQVHLEITARCNASCPMCPRNVNGGAVNPNLDLNELSLADVKRILPAEFVKQLRGLYMCGNYGDPMVAKDTLAVFEHLRDTNAKMFLHMHTNGSGRDARWWKRLAEVADVTFSVDGLADTNHLYRRSTDWKKIRRAMDAYIGAGGKANWAFIVFRHNEHQVDEARALAREWGFKKFIAKKTQRFLHQGKQVDRYPVLDRHGHHEYDLEMPEDTRHLNTELLALSSLVRRHGSYEQYLSETNITCKATVKRRIFVSAEGLVFPCCWLGRIYFSEVPNGVGERWELLKDLPGGRAALDAKRHPLRQIIEGPYFQDVVPRGWEKGAGRIATCGRVCGESDAYSAQFSELA
jgi:MoaA/NifB/PqqE/SkfB family radical SAM enzyme